MAASAISHRATAPMCLRYFTLFNLLVAHWAAIAFTSVMAFLHQEQRHANHA